MKKKIRYKFGCYGLGSIPSTFKGPNKKSRVAAAEIAGLLGGEGREGLKE